MSISSLIPFDISFNLKENTTFSQYAYDISGSETGELAGQSISKNLAGDIIAVGAPLNSGGGTARGEVRVYQKNNNSWLQLGNDLNGAADNDNFGHSVDLNGDGTILAVGTKDLSHNTLVYKYDSGSWGLYGNSIYQNVDSLVPANYTASSVSQTTTTISANCYLNVDFRRSLSSGGNFTDNHGSKTVTYYGATSSTENDGVTTGSSSTVGYVLVTPNSHQFKFGYPIEWYMKTPSSWSSSNSSNIFSLWDEAGTWFWVWASSSGKIAMQTRHNQSTIRPDTYAESSVLPTNSDVHIVMVPDDVYSIFKIYINGVLENPSSSTFEYASSATSVHTYTGDMVIGQWAADDNTTKDWNGPFKYFRLYNEDLSTTDIANLYANRDVTDFVSNTFTATTTTTVNHNFLKTGALTRPKLNKAGDKLVVFNEEHYYESEPTPLDLSANGIVQSYQYSESDASWNYLGNKIESASVNDISGGDLAINEEGNMIAIGYPQTNSATGTTKVYKYDTSWNQIGSNIDGSATGDHAGTSVVIDGSGDLVAIGSPFAGDASAGEINVYQNVADTWTLYGNKIEGQADNDQFGTSLDMTPAGNILAVGAPNANAGKGNINIYQYNETDSSWNQLGGDLSGDAVGDLTGTSVKLNQLGTEVSVGEPQPPTTSTSSDDATEIATFLSGDGNRQYVLIRINNGVGRKDGFISYTSAFNLSYLNNNYLITTSDETFDGIDITLISDASVPSVTGTNATIYLPFGDPNETTTGDSIDALVFISTSGGSGGSYYHSPHLVSTTIGYIYTSSSDDSYFLVENTDYPSTKNLGKVRTFELSHNINYEVNTFQSSYLDGFLDISGGELRTRNADDHLLIGGDASMSGNVFVKGNETIENKNIILSSTLIDISFSQLENTNFTQYAYDISGAESDGLAGHSISTSASGDIIAVGAPLNSGGGTARGEVRVYQKNNNSWLQLGNDLNGEADNDEFGHSVDLNGDGTILAVGTKDISHNTLIYKYDSGSWGLYGNSIYLNNNLNPRSETSVVATSDAAEFVVSFEFRGNDYSAGNIPTSYSDSTGSSAVVVGNVSTTSYIDDESGLGGTGQFKCTAPSVSFDLIEIYYYAVSVGGNNYIMTADGTDTTVTTMNIRLGINGDFQVYAKTNGVNVLRWWGDYGSTTSATNTWNHLVVQPKERKFWINGVQKDYTSYNIWASSGNWQTTYDTINPFRLRNGGSTDGNFCRYFRLHSAPASVSSYVSTLYTNRDVVNFGYDTVTTELSHENCSTKPKLNKTGNKLTILNELQYEDLVSNGFVQSYQYNETDTSWNYLGNKIESESLNDLSGGDIAINDEGNMIAIGYPQTNSATGTTKVYKYDTSWNQIGSNIDGSATGDHAGTSVVIDGSGDLVAIGSPFAGDASAGEINVYQNVSDTWTLYGNKIQGQADNDQFGTSIDIDSSGTILAVGAVNANGGKGNVNIYQYNETDSSWNKIGGDLSGDAVGDLTGTSVKLNQLGTEVTVGEPKSNPELYYITFSKASQKTLDWDFLIDSTTSVTDSVSGIVGTYNVGASSTQSSTLGFSDSTEGFRRSTNGGNSWTSTTGAYVAAETEVSHGGNPNFHYEIYLNPSDSMPLSFYGFTVICYLSNSQTDRTGFYYIRISGNASNFDLIYCDNTGTTQYTLSTTNPVGGNSSASHMIFSLYGTGTSLGFKATVDGNVGTMVYAGNGLGIENRFDTKWLCIGDLHNHTDPPNVFKRATARAIRFFRIYGYALTDAELIELYNIREKVSAIKGGARTFEIEHTKIYEHEYNTQSNSVIVGHNEYSRNQFATALDVSGNVDVSGSIVLTGNVTIPGDITLDALNYNSINKLPPISIDYSDITEDLSFNHKIEIMTNDNSLQTSSLTIHNDLSNNGTFGSSFVYDNSLSVTGSVVVVDASNTNYGSYTVYSKGDGSDSFMVGKSASHVFNIVNQSNVGVWMQLDGNSFHSTSDERLKKDIEDLGEETDSIMKLRPVKFHWNYEDEDKEKHIGFIAQEVEELFPDLVEENTYPDGSTYKGVDKTKLIPHLVNEIKSIKKEIEELKK